MSAAALATLTVELRDAVAARDLEAIAQCDDHARQLIATTLAGPAQGALAHASLLSLRDLYAELIREVTEHRDALAHALGVQQKRRRDVDAYRGSMSANGRDAIHSRPRPLPH